MKTISNNIAKYRFEAGLTQTELGKKVGVSKPTVADWEKHRKQPDKLHQISLIEILKVPREFLFSYDQRPGVVGSK